MAKKDSKKPTAFTKTVVHEEKLHSYFLHNMTTGMLHVGTGLKSKLPGQKGQEVHLSLPKDGKEFILRGLGGYSAKELFESPGVLKHERKKLLRKRSSYQVMRVKS